MDNVIQFPTHHEPEPEQAPEPLVIRVVVDVPEQPAITPLGVLVAVLCSVASFMLVTALL